MSHKFWQPKYCNLQNISLNIRDNLEREKKWSVSTTISTNSFYSQYFVMMSPGYFIYTCFYKHFAQSGNGLEFHILHWNLRPPKCFYVDFLHWSAWFQWGGNLWKLTFFPVKVYWLKSVLKNFIRGLYTLHVLCIP